MARNFGFALVGLLAAAAALAQGDARPFRTRAADNDARRLLVAGLARSATIRGLVTRLEQTDVIVVVHVCHVTRPALGDTRIAAVAPTVRYFQLRVSATQSQDDQLIVLGHELRHALELAAAADVRDAEGQRLLGKRLGWLHDGGSGYETQEAVDAGDAVRADLRAGRKAAR